MIILIKRLTVNGVVYGFGSFKDNAEADQKWIMQFLMEHNLAWRAIQWMNIANYECNKNLTLKRVQI